MKSPESISKLIRIFTSCFTWRSDLAELSRDFWMPDESCRVCYECDSQFTFVNRKHHCRHCGRIFCGKCTENSVPIARSDPKASLAECVRVRVCNYCFKQWEELNCASNDNGEEAVDQEFGISVLETSFTSTKSNSPSSSGTITIRSMPTSTKPYQQNVQTDSDLSSNLSKVMEENAHSQAVVFSGAFSDLALDRVVLSKEQEFRSDLEDDEYTEDQSDSEVRRDEQVSDYDKRDSVEFSGVAESGQLHVDGYIIEGESSARSPLYENFNSLDSRGVSQLDKKEDERLTGDEGEVSSSIYAAQNINAESVDFENNKHIWHPPEPEDEDDEKESFMYEDDDDEGDASGGDWGYLRPSSSFGSGEYRNRDRSGEEQKSTMKNVVYGHFRALVAQLLQVEHLPLTGENNEESWLDIITSLSWEAASLLKPDTSRTGGMDPGGYVKVKCLASGRRSESMVVRGVVCKKNVAHRRMMSKVEKPRIMILGGALEYQRVSNHLSSFDTLLQQEKDHLRMAVAKIDAHQPDVLLVENSVSRFAQDCLLKKDISLVLNIKKPLLERIARCTGAEIVPSVDHLSSLKLGFCEKFHVERFQEEHGSASQGGKKLMKTLMFFEGCPRPQAFTILLRGANGDELKKVKHVAQYGVFAAYHLGLETCFLADEGASLPELPLKSPIAVVLPNKSIERSISMIPGFSFPTSERTQDSELGEPQRSISVPLLTTPSMINNSSHHGHEAIFPPSFPNTSSSPPLTSLNLNLTAALSSSSHPDAFSFKFCDDGMSQNGTAKINKETASEDFSCSTANGEFSVQGDDVNNGLVPLEEIAISASSRTADDVLVVQPGGIVEDTSLPRESKIPADDLGPLKDEFSSEHQSILVSLSSRCVWNGTTCERSHLFRIKYYGSFDKPLGRFLRDNLFDQNFRCGSCDMESEAHVHCYTHRQGTLTISVRKQPELILPGEKEGKIWMWHRCLHCPRTNGFPPATRRIVMSDAAWGLSFGKFLELSFSNHAAASRVASCGHSLHRDCLRFYGFGNMVACFRYASIDVHSVFLPPSTLDICHENEEWINKESDELIKHAELLFSEVHTALSQISKKRHGIGQVPSDTNTQDLPSEIADLERMLQKEKREFDEALQKALNGDLRSGQSVTDILEINRLRRQLLFQTFIWDHRLVNVVNSRSESNPRNSMAEKQGKSLNVDEISERPDVHSKEEVPLAPHASDSVDEKITENQTKQSHEDHLETNRCEIPNNAEDSPGKVSSKTDIRDYAYPLVSEKIIPRTQSDGQIPRTMNFNLSNTLDAAWTGETDLTSAQEKENNDAEDCVFGSALSRSLEKQFIADEPYGLNTSISSTSLLSTKDHDIAEEPVSWLGLSFLSFYRAANKSFLPSAQKLEDLLSEYKPAYVTSFRESDLQGGPRFLLPVGVNDTVIPIYDDEPTSMIAYALASYDYVLQLSDETERLRETESFSSFSFSDSIQFQSFHSMEDLGSESTKSSTDESSFLSMYSRTSSSLDPLLYSKTLNAKVSFTDNGPHGKARYSVTCYYARRFEALRRICLPSETEYIRSLSRCKKWGAQGGKSNVFFAKTLDDRFIVKQVTRTELESFIKFAPSYFKYMSESIDSGSPTCLAKILGIYQVRSKPLKGGREWKMDVLVMENLLYRRNIIQLYDLKGSTRSRYNPDTSGTNKVLLDQNLIETMPTSPIFVGNKAKRLLERAVWNDTSFLASVDVMDYSLLVGIDSEKHELVLGIIDFLRQYTWDKHLETWVKASGLLGGPKNAPPTVVSPKQYKKRFRKAMTTYFLMVPDQWSPPNIIPSKSQTDLQEESDSKSLV